MVLCSFIVHKPNTNQKSGQLNIVPVRFKKKNMIFFFTSSLVNGNITLKNRTKKKSCQKRTLEETTTPQLPSPHLNDDGTEGK
jgi:hypothetical protein